MKKPLIRILINEKDTNKRLDIILAEKLTEYTRSNLKKIIKEKNIEINNKKAIYPSARVKIGDEITVQIKKDKKNDIKAFKSELDIIYEDKDLLVLNKPSGMVVHPGAGNYEKTLVNALVYKYKNKLSDVGGDLRPGIVHRIDKDTSGIIVSAKNDFAHIHLSNQFKKHSIKRSYFALVWGVPLKNKGIINEPIGRDPNNRIKMALNNKGKNAITRWEVVKRINNMATLIKCDLETGRTHQIRVHLASIGHEIIGDKVYKSKKRLKIPILKYKNHVLNKFHRQALHAFKLIFVHPTQKDLLKFELPVADDIRILIENLEKL